MPEEFDPFAQYEQYRQDSITGGSVPSEEDEARQRSRTAAYNRLNQAGPRRMGTAVARQAVNAMPIVGALPGVRNFGAPAGGTEGAQDLEDFRLGSPIAAGVTEAGGRALPYAAVGAGLPGLMSTGVRAGVTMGAGQGIDASMRGKNPGPAAIQGAVGGMLGSTPAKIVTPRIAFRSGRYHAGIRDDIDKIIDDATNASVSALSRINKNKGSPQDIINQQREAARRVQQQVTDVQNPPLRIPAIEDPFYRDTITGGLLGTGGSILMGQHPGMGAAVGGLLAPHIGKFIRRKANETFAEFNSRIGQSRAGRAFNRERLRYLNNQVLGDRTRAMVNAVGGSGVMETPPSLIGEYITPNLPPSLGGR